MPGGAMLLYQKSITDKELPDKERFLIKRRVSFLFL
jgi:hypothetical protein